MLVGGHAMQTNWVCVPQIKEQMGHENGCSVSSLTDGSVSQRLAFGKVLELKNAQSLYSTKPPTIN